MKKTALYLLIIFALSFLTQWRVKNLPENLDDLLISLGGASNKTISVYEENATAQQGFELVHYGRTRRNKKHSKRISKHFTCVSCHNTVKETIHLKNANSSKHRLSYAYENDIPFLQGSTFYGIVNRESWYNDDYEKKYGALVDSARYDLGASVQLCAQVCSQGRVLEKWEEEAILKYFWTIQIKTSELELPRSLIDSIIAHPSKAAIQRIKEFYPSRSPAHFMTPDEEKPYLKNLMGNHENGRKIYSLSCMKCHNSSGVSMLTLDHSKPTKQTFKNKLGTYTNFDLYQIVRWGTFPIAGHKPYMPLYPVEKLNHQQLKDLVSYITNL